MDHPLIPSGAQTYSKAPAAYPPNAPRYAERGFGCYLWADGRGYFDCVSALGAIILGYAHPEVDAAVHAQLSRGVSFSLPTKLEGDLAERLVGALPKGDWQCRFGKNGTEVVSRAVRLARAFTGRDRVLMYHNAYHGSDDWSMTRGPRNGGVPAGVRSLTAFVERHDLDDIGAAFETLRPAALVLEAVVSTDPVPPPAGYFGAVRQLCDRHGVVLILDEMVTGYRCALPGATALYGVQPDLVCYGKAIGNGHPISALVGRREIMQRIERDVFMSSTFGGEAVSLAAARATIDVLRREAVPAQLAEFGVTLGAAYNSTARSLGLDTEAYGYPQRLVLRWADPEQRQTFLSVLCEMGVLCAGYINLTLSHVQPAQSAALLSAVCLALNLVAADRDVRAAA